MLLVLELNMNLLCMKKCKESVKKYTFFEFLEKILHKKKEIASFFGIYR